MEYTETIISKNAEQGLIAALWKPTPSTRLSSLKISLQTTRRNNIFYWTKGYIRWGKSHPIGKFFNYHTLQKCNSHFTKTVGQRDSSWVFWSQSWSMSGIISSFYRRAQENWCTASPCNDAGGNKISKKKEYLIFRIYNWCGWFRWL